MTWKSFDGKEEHTAINENGKLYLDGELINNELISTLTNIFPHNKDVSLQSTITWTEWQDFDEEIKTGGKTAAAIGVLLIAACPWAGVKVILGVVGIIQSSYSTVNIKGRLRYGNDGEYYYYERYTNFYGNGEDALFDEDLFDTGKEPLEY